MALWAGLVLPAVMHGLAGPKELGKEKANCGNKYCGEPLQTSPHNGIWIDTDDREEDGYPSGPDHTVKRYGHEVVSGDTVEPGKVGWMFDVHEDGTKLDDQTRE
jgi:hypothetical protein